MVVPNHAMSIVAVGLLFVTAGCSTNVPANIDSKSPPITTQVYYGECVRLTEEEKTRAAILPAIAAAVLPSLISNTLDRFGKALRSAGEANTYPVVAQRNLEIEFEFLEPCMQWVRGRLLEAPAEITEPHLKGLEEDEQARLAELGIYLAEPAVLFIEWRIRASADRTALAIAPTYVEYNRLLQSGSADTGQMRGLAVQLSFHAPGKAPDSESAIGSSVVLGNFRVGTHRRFPMPFSVSEGFALESPWFPTYARKKPASSNTTVESDTAETLTDVDTYPMTATVTVAETRDANEFLLFLADVFDESKGNVKEVLETQLVREKRDQAELAAAQARQNKLADYYTKYANAEAKVIEYCNATQEQTSEARKQRLALSRDAYIAQADANVSAVAAGLGKPYQALIAVSDEVPVCN